MDSVFVVCCGTLQVIVFLEKRVRGMSDNTIIDKIADYYNFAVIHIAWLVKRNEAGNGSERYLVFGLVECYPKELEYPLTVREQGIKFKEGRLYYIRVKKPIEDIVEWYNAIKQNGFIPVDWEDSQEGSHSSRKRILCGNMKDVKKWPAFLLSSKGEDVRIPFIADIWNVAWTHQIFPQEREEFLKDFVAHGNVGRWLEKYLTWNISYYPELVGSVNFVLPNPFYSSRHIHMIPGEEADQVKIEFQPRQGFCLDRLKVVPFEKDYFGIAGGGKYTIENDCCSIPLSGRAGRFAMYVLGPEDEMIDYADFAGFNQGFKIDILTGYATKEIHRPKTDKEPARVDHVDVYERSGEVKGGNAENDEGDSIGVRLEKAEVLRKRKIKEKEAQVHFFYKNHREAEEFLRGLISRARSSIRIVDPYYGTDELFTYVMAVSMRDIPVEIIASKVHLGKKSRLKYEGRETSENPLIGEELLAQITDRRDGVNGKIDAYVMTGNVPVIHDRFLIIDNEAWFCGGSLNEIGNRLSCVIRLPDAQELNKLLEDIKLSDQVRPLKDWLDNREKEAADGEGQD